jgi:hypothetical protein
MDESVVEGGVDVRNAKDELAFCDLGAERYGLIFLGGLGFLRRLETQSFASKFDEDFRGHPDEGETIHRKKIRNPTVLE